MAAVLTRETWIGSRPVRGAWIETCYVITGLSLANVAPRAGRVD